MARSSSMTSDGHERLEPRLLRAAENDDVDSLLKVLALAHEYGQFSDNFLRVGLMRSAERGCVNATEFLLTQGAKTDVAGNRLSPLLRAVERDHYQIVRLLLDHGASPDSQDKDGRTAIMTAAWLNRADILQLLIMRGANVNALDHRKRNALHNLAADKECRWGWGEEIVELLLRPDCHIDTNGQDELGRTPLHWACATGNWRLAQLLLTRPDGSKIDAAEMRGKTALHIATAHDRADIVQLLLQHEAAVNACSDGGWTPLHNACERGCEAIVSILLRAGSHINSQLLNGVTPLHLAAQGGHREVVECLLKRPDLKRRVRDNFGSTPFLRAAQFKRKDIVLLLAPFNNVDSLSDDVKEASKAFDATVVDFGNFHNENRVKKMSVYNLLYGRDPENPRKQAVTTIPADSRATDFRWIHLPANNMAWVEALMTKSFIEEGAHDVDGFKGLEKSFNYQHRGQKIHSHFMRPLCQNTPRTTMRRWEKEREKEDEKPEEHSQYAPSLSTVDTTINRKLKGSSSKLDRVESHSHDEKKGNRSQKRSKGGSNPGTPKSETKIKSPWGSSDKLARSTQLTTSTLCKDPQGLVSGCNVCVFMPYLHFETAERRQKMQDAIQRAETLSFQPSMKKIRSKDEVLLDAHLSASTTSLHVRRTLDQFFYPNIDTQSRDQDQVVYRYQTKGPGRDGPGTEPKIFMVDQLWMWVLGTGLIVTSFPQRWDQPKNDPLNVLDGIIEDINSKTRDPVRSVYDLAIIITNRCSGVFDRHRLGDDEFQFLDMFESSIGIATDRETLLFNRFNHASVQASAWLKSHRKLNKFSHSSARSIHARDGVVEDDPVENEENYLDDGQPLFVDRLLDIGEETDLLAEAKDIRDELNMIRTVLDHQKHVLQDFQEVICEIYQGQHRSQHEVKKRFKDQQRMIDMHLKDIERMDKQAERIYHSITDLLDLKQKHANAFEARFARDQAAGTTRQSKTIMVFTIVTIVFLPLSFITSIFTINLKEFSNLNLQYVAKYTFGVGFAISIPLVFLALSVDDIGDFFRMGRRWLSRKNEPVPTSDREIQLQTLEFEKMISLARSRRSGELDYGPSLLPVSTRGTGVSRRLDPYANGLANGNMRKSYELRRSADYRPYT